MKLTTRTRYGTRVAMQLAEVYPEGTVSVKELSEEQEVSNKYLEQIIAVLKKAGLVESVLGPHGGYSLTRPPWDVTLGDIYRALEGSAAPVACVDDPEVCHRHPYCPTRRAWVELKESLERVLDGTTLQDLLCEESREAEAPAAMYYI